MSASSAMKSSIKTVAKVSKAKKKANIKRPSRRKYNDTEKKELSKLRGRNRYYRKQINKINKDLDSMKTPMQYIRSSLSEDLAYLCYQKGYFEEPEYSSRDIVEWMSTNGDNDLLKLVLEEYNSLNPAAPISYGDDGKNEKYKKINDYNDLIAENDKKIKNIQDSAAQRKNEETLKYLQYKQSMKDTKNLIQALSQGKIAIETLTNPEIAAIRFMKTELIKAVYSQIDFDSIPDDYKQLIKRSIYSGIMEDPIKGLQSALRGTVALKVTDKYGIHAGELAGGMMDFATSVMTGKPHIKGAAKTLFDHMVNKSPLNKALMIDISEDLINSGKSTSDEENAKMFGRDVLVDIGKNIIATGGNIIAAMPGIVKDIVADAGQASIRKIKYDKEDAEEKEREKKRDEAIKKAAKKSADLDMEAILAKFEQK